MMTTHQLTFRFPLPLTLACPVCGVSYFIYPSWTRHISQAHPADNLDLTFECSLCASTYPSKRSISTHFRVHKGEAATATTTSSTSDHTTNGGSFHCEFCNRLFPSKRSRSQHVRNQHPAEASDSRALAAATHKPSQRKWTPEEHTLFVDAMTQFGPSPTSLSRTMWIPKPPSRWGCIREFS